MTNQRIIKKPGIPWAAIIDGNDVIVRNVLATSFGGGFDKGDNGETESGVMNDGRDPHLMGCALPIRSTEHATKGSPLASATHKHIPWGTEVIVWRQNNDESHGISCKLIDNGPDVSKYPDHGFDATIAVAQALGAKGTPKEIANGWSGMVCYRIKGAAKYLDA